jgi:hypothetical protein
MAHLPVVEEIIDPKEVQKAPQDSLIGAEVQRTTRLRARTILAPPIDAPQIRAARKSVAQ